MLAARPALTALSCRSCQKVIFRAVLSTSLYRVLPQPHVGRQKTLFLPRAFSSDAKNGDSQLAQVLEENDVSKQTVEDIEKELEEDQPWFLEEEAPRHAPSLHKANLPTTPEDAPALIGPMIKYVYEDMGLDDISLLDLRDLETPASLGPNLIMLFGTARSERHLHISAGRFQRWLKRNHKVSAKADGLIGAGELKTKLRRLRRKAKLMGSNIAMSPGGDYGISTGWVCVNFLLNDSKVAEEARLDDQGKFSGFGATQTGTTVVIQCMTEGMRKELDLEALWKSIMKRNLEQQVKIRGEQTVDPAKIEETLASKLQIYVPPPTAAQLQWEAFHEKLQKRQFSTSAQQLASINAPIPTPPEESMSLEDVRQRITAIQLGGESMDEIQFKQLLEDIMTTPSSTNLTGEQTSAPERLMLTDELIRTASERNLEVDGTVDFANHPHMLAHLLASMLKSPAYGPHMSMPKSNLEFLISQCKTPPSEAHLIPLIYAYAHCKEWEGFWDTFRLPLRFGQPRSEFLYKAVLDSLTATKDIELCMEPLMNLYNEMALENPAVDPSGVLHDSLIQMIFVMDRAVEEKVVTRQKDDSRILKLRGMLRELRMLREYRDPSSAMASFLANYGNEEART